MKVVIFCGGLGMRIRETDNSLPKPMIEIGYRPILWHVMKYYAHFGHKEFILCLGYRGDIIKNYFLNYDECLSNDFTLSWGGKKLDLHNSDIHDWEITFADTGIHSNIGQRLVAVKKYLEKEDVFLANYADGLTDLDLNRSIENFNKSGKIASFLCMKPNLSFHAVTVGQDGSIADIRPIADSNLLINAGYFIFRKDIFRYIHEGEELVIEPFQRLVQEKQLIADCHQGFFQAMDTLKDKHNLELLHSQGEAPWELWQQGL
jgi:glucose-1-phosphate cytidylyltransferase